MNTTKEFPARIKVGANKDALVYVQSYDKDAKKFFIQWPSSPASVGYFHMDQLHPDGDWHFGADNTLQPGKKPRPEFPNGDPFELIEEGMSFFKGLILVELVSGVITVARPFKGFLCQGTLYANDAYQEDLLSLCDTDYEGPEVTVTTFDHVIRLQDVVAWQPMPKSLRA